MNATKKRAGVRARALELARDPLFLHLAMKKIGDLGVVGEEANRLTLLLAGLTKDFDEPVSVLVKGSTSSGKSYLMRKVVQVFPPEWVLTRASLSGKAPVHGRQTMAGKILYLYEYRGGKDAQLLLRLQQSEGDIAHEYATVVGARSGTKVARRLGAPVVLTSTTEEKVVADDETRCLSIHLDESPEQTLAIVRARIRKSTVIQDDDLIVWHEALRLICKDRVSFNYPQWLDYAATKLPIEHGRLRRDWSRFLTLCQAVTLCRRFATGQEKARELAIDFSDYRVAYKILNSAFASTAYGVHPLELEVAEAVRTLSRDLGGAVTVRQLVNRLHREKGVVYKYVKQATEHKLIMYQSGTQARNLKPLLPVPHASVGFLVPPFLIQRDSHEIDEVVRYVDPIAGKTMVLRRKTTQQGQSTMGKRGEHDV